MNGKMKILLVIALLVVLALACDLSSQGNEPVDQAAIDTMVAQTIAAEDVQPPDDGGSSGGGDTGGDTGGDDGGQAPPPTETQSPPPTDTPQPTETSTPEPTPTFTPEPTLPLGIDELNLGNPDVIFRFDNSSSVYTFPGADNKAEVKDGTYQFTMVGEIDYTVWAFPFAKELEDYYFEVAITMPDDCVGKDKAGIIFGTPPKETDNGINYQISCDGHYRLWIYDGTDTIYLIGWTKSDELFSGPGKTNKIGVMHRNNKITLYINGTLVDQLSDDTYSGKGRIGFNIGVDKHYNVTFKFDNAAYWTNLP